MLGRLDDERNRTLILLAALTAIALTLDLWQGAARRSGRATALDAAVCTISRPVQSTLVVAAEVIAKEWWATVRARELVDENASLQIRLAELEGRLLRAEEARGAAARATSLLSSAPPSGRRGPLAHVIGMGQGGWSDYLTLDRGSSHGVRQRDVVVTADGVVGQVYAVTTCGARVMPLTEPASAIAVRVHRSRETAVLKGLGDWRCEVRYLDPEADVRPGDRVITSGLGGIFPSGLRVGVVTEVTRDRYTPGKVAQVAPSARLRRLEEVLILRGQPAN